MGHYWIDIYVYYHNKFLGSITTYSQKKEEWIKEINEKFGAGNWTRYNVDHY